MIVMRVRSIRSIRVRAAALLVTLLVATFGAVPTSAGAAAAARGAVAGTVSDSDGAPLAKARIAVFDLQAFREVAVARTGRSGQYRLSVPAGRYFVSAYGANATGGNSDATGYLSASYRSAVRSGATLRHDLVLRPGGAVSGRVTDADGRPLSGVQAYLGPVWPYVDVVNAGIFSLLTIGFGDGTATTNRSGRFTIRGVHPGNFLACYDPSEQPVRGGAGTAAGYLGRCLQPTVIVRAGVIAPTATAALTAARGGALSGLVRDATGAPLRGAEVEITPAGSSYPTGYTQTGAHGRLRVGALAPGDYRLCSTGQYASNDRARTGSAYTCGRSLTVAAGATTHTVLRLRAGGAVTGTVTDPAGRPVRAAYVRVGGYPNGGDAYTDSDGRYRITGVVGGTRRVCVQDTSYADVAHHRSGVSPGCLDSTVQVRARHTVAHADLELELGGAIAGRLTFDTGHPVRYAEISVQSQHSFGFADVEGNGTYLIRGLAPGDYYVCVDAITLGGEGQVNCPSHHIHVERGRVSGGHDFTFHGGPSTTVRVRDEQGRPVAGANAILLRSCGRDDYCDQVPVFDADRYVTVAGSWITDARGLVHFRNVRPGSYAVCALGYHAATAHGVPPTGFADACTGSTFTVTVSAGEPARAKVTLPVGGQVTGTVTDADGAPLRNALLHVTGSPADDIPGSYNTTAPYEQNVTDPDGSVTIRGVRPGTAKVCVDASDASGGVSAGGYLDMCATTTITVTAGGTTTFGTIALAPGGAITGRVLSKSGAPVREVYIFTDGPSSSYDDPEVFSDNQGNYRVDRLRSGTYKVCFEPFRQFDAQCYDKVPWDDRRPPPSNVTKVTVVAGQVTSGIDAALVPR